MNGKSNASQILETVLNGFAVIAAECLGQPVLALHGAHPHPTAINAQQTCLEFQFFPCQREHSHLHRATTPTTSPHQTTVEPCCTHSLCGRNP